MQNSGSFFIKCYRLDGVGGCAFLQAAQGQGKELAKYSEDFESLAQKL